MTAAIYARKSTDQQVSDEQKSVARQVEHARLFAARKGWTVDEAFVFVDDGISGAEFARRPGFLRLMNALKPRPPFQVLIMSEESRLGREAIETAYALKQLVTAGVRVFFYLEGRERTLDSPTDKIMLSLTAFADELERERGRQRTYDAMMRKAKAGHVTGGRLFGYDNIDVTLPGGKRSHVTRQVNEAEAAIVCEIFRLCAAGAGMKTIAKQLNDVGAVSPRAQRGRSSTWAPSSVREVLFREAYRGRLAWNRTRKRDRWGVHHQTARPEGDWIDVPMPDWRIVSDELWTAAHARLASAREVYQRGTKSEPFGRPPLTTESKYLLTGLLECGQCGETMYVRSGSHGIGRRWFYVCSGYHMRGRTVCGNRWSVPMLDVDDQVLEALVDDVLDQDVITEAVDEAVRLLQAPPSEGNLAPLEQELEQVTVERQRYLDAIARGGQLEGLLEALSAREARKRTIEAQLLTLRAQTRLSVPGAARLREELLEIADDTRSVLRRRAPRVRSAVTMLLDGRVTVTPRDGEWELRGAGTYAGLFSGRLFPKGVASPRGTDGLWRVDFLRILRAA